MPFPLKVRNYKVANNPSGSHFHTLSNLLTVGTFVPQYLIIKQTAMKPTIKRKQLAAFCLELFIKVIFNDSDVAQTSKQTGICEK